jgi:predicted PurR-regulated permease PerM
LAAAIGAVTVVLLIVMPVLGVTYQFAREAGPIAEKIQVESDDGSLREKVAEAPILGHVLTWMDRANIEVESEVRKIVQSTTQDAASLFHGSITAAIQFLVAIFILYFLFLDHSELLHGLRGLLPLSKTESDHVLKRFAESVHASLYANVGTSVIDAVGGGLMFWILGLPAPLLWGLVMFFVSLLPMVGAAFVWLPAVAYLAVRGELFAAIVLFVWGVLSAIIVDHIIYVRMVGQGMRMHSVPALIAFLGGIAVFGVTGLILGPAILAVTLALLEVWKERLTINGQKGDAPS